jgi:hypothetical protein
VTWNVTLGREVEVTRLRNEFSTLEQQIVDETFFQKSRAEQKLIAGRAEVFAQALLKAQLGNLLGPFLSVVALSTFALIVYRRHPQRIRKRYGALPLTEENAPSAVRQVQLLARQHNISPVPSLECSTRRAEPLAAMTFGFRRSPVLLFLSGSPRILEKAWDDGTWNNCYTAVALHELGHIAEGDAQDREQAKAIWWALAIGGYLPLLLVLLIGTFLSWRGKTAPIPIYLSAALALQFTVELGVVFAIWLGLSRVRERYADWRAVSGGMQKTLKERSKHGGFGILATSGGRSSRRSAGGEHTPSTRAACEPSDVRSSSSE